MTYKYRYIRRAIYEENPASKLNLNRSFTDMGRLFKRPIWIMLGILLVAIIFTLIIVIYNLNTHLLWIPSFLIVLISFSSQIIRERYFYNDSIRVNELSKKNHNYEQYVSDVWDILRTYGIDTPDKVKLLKTECETLLKSREDKYTTINNKIIDILIGVPLGALIASIIYADHNAVPIAIGVLILVGLAVLGVVKLIRFINYYSEGYFKDRYLLDAVSELNYSE